MLQLSSCDGISMIDVVLGSYYFFLCLDLIYDGLILMITDDIEESLAFVQRSRFLPSLYFSLVLLSLSSWCVLEQEFR